MGPVKGGTHIADIDAKMAENEANVAPARPAWFRLLRSLLLAYVAIIVLAMIFEERLIYFPRPYDGGPHWTPMGINHEDVFFTAEDGTNLHGWYCPVDEPRAVVLFAHGNAGNISGRAMTIALLQKHLDASVFCFDYRGYGQSDGRPNETGVLQDARAARGWLLKRVGLESDEIVLMGRSLGGAVAVDLAADGGARALVLESTFTSLPDIGARQFPWLPVRLLMRSKYDSLSKIERYDGPLFQSHGDADAIVPFEFGRKLHEAAAGVKEFFVCEGGDHNDPQPVSYYHSLDGFLRELP